MTGYVNGEEVKTAKISILGEDLGSCLFYISNKELISIELISSSGFLLCQIGENEIIHSFNILGKAKNCRMGLKPIENCYYDLNVKLQVVDPNSPRNWKRIGIVIGVILGIA